MPESYGKSESCLKIKEKIHLANSKTKYVRRPTMRDEQVWGGCAKLPLGKLKKPQNNWPVVEFRGNAYKNAWNWKLGVSVNAMASGSLQQAMDLPDRI